MKLFYLVLVGLCVCLLFSCTRDEYTDDIPSNSKIVVEGWIEEGDVARVIITRSIPITATVDSSNFLNYVIRSAMVIVSNDTDSDTLRLISASQYLPPYVYVGEKIIGKQGKNYTLTVKYLGTTLTAESTIPPSVPIKNIRYIKKNPNDTVGNISVEFTDPVNQHNYYQIATFLDGYDEIFIPALYGNLNDENFVSTDIDFKITRGITIFPHTNFESHFTDGDRIRVKLRTMTKDGFDFWNLWQNEIVNAQNPIFPANTNLKSNIKGGGIGIWCGYGQDTRLIIAN